MSIFTQEMVESVTSTNGPDDIIHLVCECDEDVAFCGERFPPGKPFRDNEEANCVVCLDLDQFACERCGE